MDKLAEWLRVAAEGVSVTWRRARPVISCADFTVRKGEISRPSRPSLNLGSGCV